MKKQNRKQLDIEPIVEQLDKLQTLTLEDNARERIWRNALAQAQTQAAAPSFVIRFQHLYRAALSILCVLVFMFAPVRATVQAQKSLPGESLYRLKRASEHMWLQVLPAEKQKAVRMTLLDRRISEVEQLANASQPIPQETLTELEAMFRVMAVSETLWQPEDKPLVAYLEQYEKELFDLAVKHRELYTLRYVYRASFYAKQQLENTATHTDIAQYTGHQ